MKKKCPKTGRYVQQFNEYDLSHKAHALLYLPTGQSVLFDHEDFDILKDRYWSLNDNGYVQSQSPTKITLHRRILCVAPDLVVDHLNHDKLDNRKENLRMCTRQQNAMNRSKKIRGVYKRPNGKFQVNIRINYALINLGTYDNYDEAVRIRKQAEQNYFGDFAPQENGNGHE